MTNLTTLQISLLSPIYDGIKPSLWLHIVHIKPGLLDTLVKPLYLGYGGYGDIRFVNHGDITILIALPADFW
jgi:hypothetical protein